MPLIKKIDVKNYLSSPKRNGFRPYPPESPRDAPESAVDTSGRANSNANKAIEETSNQHSLSGTETLQTKTQSNRSQTVSSGESKSVRG